MNKRKKVLAGALSPYTEYCDGFGSPGASGNNYITAVMLDVGVTKCKWSHQGSILLDKIISFDKAEVSHTNIGQINMIMVSSFCGPAGLVWGYDLVRGADFYHAHPLYKKGYALDKDRKVNVYSAQTLREATHRLFGSVQKKRFPLLPGGHIPCAGKHISLMGPDHIYAALALAIPHNREREACLFMEDIGQIVINRRCDYYKMNKKENTECDEIKSQIIENLAHSVIEIGRNQNINYEEIFIDVVDVLLPPNYIGCALVAAPYFTLAKNAISKKGINSLFNEDLEHWEKSVKNNFLD